MTFETESIQIQINALDVKLTTVTNIDALYDALIAKGDDHEDVKDERLPYWAELWASAIGLSTYLTENQFITPDKIVLEIGCGLGLPSIVSGILGAKEVIMTDYLPEALVFAQQNWEQNLPLNKVQFVQMDWRTPLEGMKADVILASDVAYESRAFKPLLSAFETLAKPDATIIIAEPNRPIAQSYFGGLNTEGGYQVEKTTKKVERKGHIFTVNIYQLNNNCMSPISEEIAPTEEQDR